LAWYGKKLNLTQLKDSFVNQKKSTTKQNTHKKLKPGLVAFYDIRRGNGAGLFSQEKIREEIRGSPEKQSLTRPE